MFLNSSSPPAFNASSGHFSVCAVRSWLGSTDGMSHKISLTAAMHRVNKLLLSAFDACSDSLLLDVSVVNFDAPPGLISDSPLFLSFGLASSSLAIPSGVSHVSSFFPSPSANISCSILARQSSVCGPIPTQPWHPVVRPYLSRMLWRRYNLLARLPLANSSFGWIVGPCGGVLLLVALHGQTHKFKKGKSQAPSPSRRLTQSVLVAPVGVRKRNSSVRSSMLTKTPRIHLTFNLAPSSECSRPKQSSPSDTTSPV